MSLFELGPFKLDAERLLLFDHQTPVALGPKVVETLLALVEQPGVVVTKAALLGRIWPDGYIGEANLAQNIYVLRKTLRARWNAVTIETVPRRGYRFVGTVRQCKEERPVIAAPLPSARTRWQALAAAAVLVLALGAGLAAWALPRDSQGHPGLSAEGARLYAIGRYYWNLRTPSDVSKSREYFVRVVDRDPDSALGYAALASVDAIMGDYKYGPYPPQVYFSRARAYARKALAIDPNSGEAYAVLGFISEEGLPSEQQMERAVNDLHRAIRIDPQNGAAHEWYGIALIRLGRIHAAYAELGKAADLDPLSVATVAWLGNAAYLERRYDAAIAYARETLDLSPRRAKAYETLGLAYEAQGDRTRAVQAFLRLAHACTACKPQAAALLADIYARANDMRDARAQLAIARAHTRDVAPDDLAAALVAIGEPAIAIAWLRRMQRTFVRAEIANDPRFDLLRNDPQAARFENPA